MRAEERLAAFLLNLVQRLHAAGFSQSELVLRMTREEIGSYLGLKLETVSRTFSKFVDDGIIEVKQRHIHILDTDALRSASSTPAGLSKCSYFRPACRRPIVCGKGQPSSRQMRHANMVTARCGNGPKQQKARV